METMKITFSRGEQAAVHTPQAYKKIEIRGGKHWI